MAAATKSRRGSFLPAPLGTKAMSFVSFVSWPCAMLKSVGEVGLRLPLRPGLRVELNGTKRLKKGRTFGDFSSVLIRAIRGSSEKLGLRVGVRVRVRVRGG